MAKRRETQRKKQKKDETENLKQKKYGQTEKPEKEYAVQHSRLLALPLERRLMIWEAAIDADQLVLYASDVPRQRYRCYQPMLPRRVPRLNLHLQPEYAESVQCGSIDRFQEALAALARKNRSTNVAYNSRVRYAVDDIPKPMSWLATCRQIHDEASRLVSRNLHVHLCNNPRILAAPFGWAPPLYKITTNKVRRLTV